MDFQNINIGNAPNDGLGDTGRAAGAKINANFAHIDAQWDTLATVAFTGNYEDLINKPAGGGGGVSSWTELSDIPSIIEDYSLLTPGSDQIVYYDTNGDPALTDVTSYGLGLLATTDENELVSTLNLGSAALSETTDFATASHVHSDATTGAAGFMSAADKTKLNSVAANATANAGTVTNLTIDGTGGITVANGTITSTGTATVGVNAAQLRTTLNVANGATANSADATLLDRANHTGTQAISTVTNLQSTLDGKVGPTHNHTLEEILTLIEELDEIKLQIALLKNGGSIGQFLSSDWALTTGSAPGELIVTIINLPSSSVTITHIGYLVDDITTLIPVTNSFIVQSSTAGVSETVQIWATDGDAANTIRGEISESKTATSGAATVPTAFSADDWDFTASGGPQAGVIEVLGLPDDRGSTITAVQYQANGGAWVSLSNTTIGTYPITLTGLSGSVSMHLRAVNAVGNSASTAVAKTASLPAITTVPATFAANQWDFAPGTLPGAYSLNIIALPGNGGSAITALEYTLNAGVSWVALTGTGTGVRQLTGFTAGAVGTARVRAVNAVGNGTQSATKTANATTGSVVIGGAEVAVGNERRHTLTTGGDLEVHGTSKIVKWELVAPGGSGGCGRGGGGGGGEIKRWNDPGQSELTLAVGTHTYVHGAFGEAPTAVNLQGNQGGTSTFGGKSVLGGGAGAGVSGTPGGTGGSGGGGRGGAAGVSSTGGAASGNNTNVGGGGFTDPDSFEQNGGGGGGAGSAGGAATASNAGVGGNGEVSIAPGVTTIYSGGGGGGRSLTTGDGALGGNAGTTGGQGAGGTTSGNQATAGITPGSGGGGGTGVTRLPGAGAPGILHVWYETSAGPGDTADVIVTNTAQLTTALNAVPSNLNRRYIIGLSAGFTAGGVYAIPNNYNKGTTLVQIRSQDRASPARFNRMSLQNGTNVEIEGLRIWNEDLDQFGYGANVSLLLHGLKGVGIHRARVRNCDIRGGVRGIYAANTKFLDVCYNSIRGASVDQNAFVSANSAQETQGLDFFNNQVSNLHPTRLHPDLTDTIGYALDRACSIDPRRSDQKNGNFQVRNLAGVLVNVSGEDRDNRHPDLLQGWGRWNGVKIRNNHFWGGNVSNHTIFHQNAIAQNPAYSVGVEVRRNFIHTAHTHGTAFIRVIDPIVEDNLYRHLVGADWYKFYSQGAVGNNVTAIMKPQVNNNNLDLEGLHPTTRVQMVNNVLPAELSTGNDRWNPAWANIGVNGHVRSDTAFPTGWAGFDVALGRVGPYGYEN